MFRPLSHTGYVSITVLVPILAVVSFGCSDGQLTAKAVPNVAPAITIRAPLADSVHAEDTPLVVEMVFEDDMDVDEVELSVGSDLSGALYGAVSRDGGEAVLDLPEGLEAGVHILTARAIDTEAEFGEHAVSVTVIANSDPEVEILSPVEGATFEPGEPLTVTASIVDDFDTNEDLLVVLETFAGGSLSPELDINGQAVQLALPEGLDVDDTGLRLSAYDAGGLVGVAEVALTAEVNAAPSVTMLSPADNEQINDRDFLLVEALVEDDTLDLSAHVLTWTGLAESATCSTCVFPEHPAVDGTVSFYAELACREAQGSVTHTLGLKVTDPDGATDQAEHLVQLFCHHY